MSAPTLWPQLLAPLASEARMLARVQCDLRDQGMQIKRLELSLDYDLVGDGAIVVRHLQDSIVLGSRQPSGKIRIVMGPG